MPLPDHRCRLLGIRGMIGVAAPKGIAEDVKTTLEAAVYKVVTSSE